MGNWTLTVTGTGPHHNDNNPTDIDRMAPEFIEALRKGGHNVESGHILFPDAALSSASAIMMLSVGPTIRAGVIGASIPPVVLERAPVGNGVVNYVPAREAVVQTKQHRKDLDEVLQRLKRDSGQPVDIDAAAIVRSSRERALAITKIEEAIMWLGMDLKAQGTPNPYPNSKNPASPVIDPTADGLKM